MQAGRSASERQPTARWDLVIMGDSTDMILVIILTLLPFTLNSKRRPVIGCLT